MLVGINAARPVAGKQKHLFHKSLSWYYQSQAASEKQKLWKVKRSKNVFVLIWSLNSPATRWSETAAPVLSCSSTRAFPALQMQPGKYIYSSFFLSPSPVDVGQPSRPSPTTVGSSNTLLTSHLLANLAKRRRRTRTEDVIPPLYFCSHQSERDFFQVLLWSLFHTTFLASFCPQSLLTSDFLFFSLRHSNTWIIHFDDPGRWIRMRGVLTYVWQEESYRKPLCFFPDYELKDCGGLLCDSRVLFQLTLLVSSGLISVSCTSCSSSIFLVVSGNCGEKRL